MSPPAHDSNPFPGLRPFRANEAHLFFGRENQTLRLLETLASHRFVAVVGTSGSGKSSLVRCGLLSELQGGKLTEAGSFWDVAVMRPGGAPMDHLAEALLASDLYDDEEDEARNRLLATLRRSHFGLVEAVRQSDAPSETNVLLVVDQFEEIFRFQEAATPEKERADEFVSLLLEAARQREVPVYVVLTMRSDFIGDCAGFEGLAEAVNDGEFLIPRLTRDQYKRVIEGPIRVGGGRLTPRLLQRLLNDLGEERDQLPCLQHALMRTWVTACKRSSPPELDLEDYRGVGGMHAALSLHADEVYDALPDSDARLLCERLFRSLTWLETENRGVRRPQRLETLCRILDPTREKLDPYGTAAYGGRIPEATLESVTAVVDVFRAPGVTFLMPPAEVPLKPDTVVDVSHESLMRVWTRLRQWVAAESQSVGIYGRLAESARLHGGGKAGLYRDPELGIALAWREANRPSAAWADQHGGGFGDAMAFLDASRDAAEAQDRERDAARQRELHQARELAASQSRAATALKRFAGALAAGLAVAVGLTVWAFQLQKKALDNELEARNQRAKAENAFEESARLALEQQVLKAQQMFESDKGSEGMSVLAAVLREDPNHALAARRLVTALIQRPFVRPLWPALDNTLADPVVTPDGNWLVFAADGIQMLNLSTGEIVADRFPGTQGASGISVSGDGTRLAVARNSDVVSLWTLPLGDPIGERKAPMPVQNVGFSPDATMLAGFGGNQVAVWRMDAEGGPARVLSHAANLSGFAFSPDGSRLAVTATNNELAVWDLESQAPPLRVPNAGGATDFWRVFSPIAFDTGGRRILTAGWTTARIYDSSTGEELAPPLPQSYPIRSVAFSPDDRWVATASNDRRAQIWDANTGSAVGPPIMHHEAVNHAVFSPDGRHLLTGSRDGTARVWSVPDGAPISEPIHLGANVLRVGFRPDGLALYTVDGTGRIQTWDLRSNAYRGRILPEDLGRFGFNTVRFSSDGTQVATGIGIIGAYNYSSVRPGAGEIKAQVWNTGTGKPIGPPLSRDSAADAMLFGSSGKHLATYSNANLQWTVWSLESMEAVWKSEPKFSVSFHPSADILIAASTVPGEQRGRVMVVDAVSTEVMAEFERIPDLRFAQFTPDGESVLVDAGPEVGFQFWNWRVPEARGPAIPHGQELNWHVLSRNGKRIGAVAGDRIRVWDLEEGSSEGPGIPNTAYAIRDMSPDGSRIVTTPARDVAQIWNVSTGEPAVDPFFHEWIIATARFSPDGQSLLTGSWDDTARMWDVATGMPLSDPWVFPDWIHSVAFHPNGRLMALLCRLSGVHLIEVPNVELPVPEWLCELAEAVAGRRVEGANRTTVLDPQTWFERAAKLETVTGEGPNEHFLQWYLRDADARTISPDSSLTVAEWKRETIAQETAGSLRAVLEIDPTNAAVNARLARQLLSDQRSFAAQAELHSRQAIRSRPNWPEAWWTRAMIFARQGAFEAAEDAWRTAVERGADDANAWMARAWILDAQSEREASFNAVRTTFQRLETEHAGPDGPGYLMPPLQRFWTLRAESGGDGIAAANHLLDQVSRYPVLHFLPDVLPRVQWENNPQNPRAWALAARLAGSQGEYGLLSQSPLSRFAEAGDTVEVSASVSSTAVSSIQWFHGDQPIAGATNTTLRLEHFTADMAGPYRAVVASVQSSVPVFEQTDFAHVALKKDGVVHGALLNEVYTGIPGNSLWALNSHPRFPLQPTEKGLVTQAEWQCGGAVNLASRISGWLIPPTTGKYQFALVGDDFAVLSLGADASRASLRPVAVRTTWSGHRAWAESAKSEPIRLEAGRRYALEILLKQAWGGGHVSVTWRLPGAGPISTTQEPISSDHLAFPEQYFTHGVEELARDRSISHLLIPQRSDECSDSQIDLTGFYNAGLSENWHTGLQGLNLATMPQGLREVDGIAFDVRGVVQLGGQNLERVNPLRFPQAVHGIPVHRKVRRLHVFHGTGWNEKPGAAIADLEWHFEDGTTETTSILYGTHVVDWRLDAPVDVPPESTVAWEGNNDQTRSGPAFIRLYRTTWENPHPEKALSHLDYVSANSQAAPFLIAVTTE